MKKVLVLVLALVLAMSMVAVASAEEQPTYKFEVVSKGFQSTYWLAVQAGAEAEIAAINEAAGYEKVSMHLVGPDQETNFQMQHDQFDAAIKAAPDALALAACNAESMGDLLPDVQAAGIPLICFDSLLPDAPEGVVTANAATNNYNAGTVAAEGMWAKIKDRVAAAEAPVRIGEINQESVSESITQRGIGFIDKIIELAAADGKTVAVTGNEVFVNGASGETVDEAEADIIIEAYAAPESTAQACSVGASPILTKEDTIAVFGSNQMAAEGIIMANETLMVCGSGDDDIIAVGFDSGTPQRAAVTDGTMYGSVTQSPVNIGHVTIQLLLAAAEGEKVEDADTGCAFYTAENIDSDEIAPNLYE